MSVRSPQGRPGAASLVEAEVEVEALGDDDASIDVDGPGAVVDTCRRRRRG
jgi:hypothetical protein